MDGIYSFGYIITFLIVFVGTWIYCIAAYGFLLGVGIGRLPAAITAGLVALVWPLILLAVVALVILLLAA